LLDGKELLLWSAVEKDGIFELVHKILGGPVTNKAKYRTLKALESSQRLKNGQKANRSPSKTRDQFEISGFFSRWG